MLRRLLTCGCRWSPAWRWCVARSSAAGGEALNDQ